MAKRVPVLTRSGLKATTAAGGWLADRFGPRRILLAATLSWTLLTLAIGLVGAQGSGNAVSPRAALVTLRFLLGVTQACGFPTFVRAVGNWVSHRERALAMGLVQSAAVFGGALTPLIVHAAIGQWGWRASFGVSALATVVITVLWWGIATDVPAQHARVTADELRYISQGRVKQSGDRGVDWVWVQQAFRRPTVYALCGSQFCFGITGFAFFSWFFTYFVEQRGAAAADAALLQSAAFVAMTVGATAGGYLSDRAVTAFGHRWGRRLVPLATMTLAGACGIVAPLAADNTQAGLLFALGAAFMYALTPCFWSTVIDLTQRGTGVLGGLQNGTNWLGSALATTGAAHAIDWLQATQVAEPWTLTFQVAAAVGVLSGLLWLGIDASQSMDEHRGAGLLPDVPGFEGYLARGCDKVVAAD